MTAIWTSCPKRLLVAMWRHIGSDEWVTNQYRKTTPSLLVLIKRRCVAIKLSETTTKMKYLTARVAFFRVKITVIYIYIVIVKFIWPLSFTMFLLKQIKSTLSAVIFVCVLLYSHWMFACYEITYAVKWRCSMWRSHILLNDLYFEGVNCQRVTLARTRGWRGGSIIEPCVWVNFGTGLENLECKCEVM